LLRRIVAQDAPPREATFTDAERRILLGLHFTLWG